jgi:hypothetical protein
MFVSGAPIESVSVAYNEIASTRQSFACSLFLFDDPLTAQNGFESACDEIRPPFRYPNIGEQACRGAEREGEVVLIVRSGPTLIWIWADDNGQGIETVAGRILDRLNK